MPLTSSIQLPRVNDWIHLNRVLSALIRRLIYGHVHVYNETPPEPCNGSNMNYSTSNKFVSGTLKVYWNGQLLLNGYHFSEDSDKNGYTFLRPQRTGMMWHEYHKSIS